MSEIIYDTFSSTTHDGFYSPTWSVTSSFLRPDVVKRIERKRLNRTQEINSAFCEHAKLWKKEVAYISSSTIRHKNEHYQAIIKLGEAVIPFILRELKKGPSDWFFALYKITGEDPVSKEDMGNFRKMSDHWLDWGRRRGYLSQ